MEYDGTDPRPEPRTVASLPKQSVSLASRESDSGWRAD